MDRDHWLELNRRSLAATLRALAASAGGEVAELDGVTAVINPAARERSVFNSVVYEDAAALAAAQPELARRYERHGCAWTVWVPEDDRQAAALLERAGHRLDAEPRAMGIELAGCEEPDLSHLEWEIAGGIEEAAALNDAAYGYPPGTWIRGTGPDPEGLITYVARLDGEPASTVAARYEGGDGSIWNVATAPAARGRGLAGLLMRKALHDAAAAGCETSTLQATKLGRPVYERVGYRDFGALQMWEHRTEGSVPPH